MTTHKLQVKLGAHEFNAEGQEQTVQAQYQLFLQAVAAAAPTTPPTQPPKGETPAPVIEGDNGGPSGILPSNFNFERAFRDDERSGVVSLRTLPATPTPDLDTVLLLVYGFQRLNNEHDATAMQIMKGVRQSGLNIVRLDRLLGQRPELVRRGGKRKGTRYSLTNLGIAYAERLLQEMFS